MRAVVQRVSVAEVTVAGKTISQIGSGLLVFVGVQREDTEADTDYLVDKIANLRIFEGEDYKMNKSVVDIGGDLLLVSQFTLVGDVRRGRRPSFSDAEKPEVA